MNKIASLLSQSNPGSQIILYGVPPTPPAPTPNLFLLLAPITIPIVFIIGIIVYLKKKRNHAKKDLKTR